MSTGREALDSGTPVELNLPIRNVHRSVGAMLSGEIARRYGSQGLPDDTIQVQLHRLRRPELRRVPGLRVSPSARRATPTITSARASPAGASIIYPPRSSEFVAEENILVGNVCLYGATSGEVFFNGMAGERFAVRNSGATAVVEGVGDHGCEYMTNGLVVVLGKIGRNFAAGMTGGIAYVLDDAGDFARSSATGARSTWNRSPIANDVALLRGLISRHVQYTGSPQASWILDNWEATLAASSSRSSRTNTSACSASPSARPSRSRRTSGGRLAGASWRGPPGLRSAEG